MNLLVDFHTQRWAHGPQAGEDSLWSFRFGKCDDFQGALRRLKSLSLEDRHYIPEKNHLWEVRPSPRAEAILSQAFDNFKSCLETARHQLPLF